MTVKLDGRPLRDFGIELLSPPIHPATPPTHDITLRVPRKDGLYYYDTRYDERTFTLECGIIRELDVFDLQRRLREFAVFLLNERGKPRDIKLTFDYEPDKYYTVKFRGQISPDRIFALGSFILTLVADDPYAYSNVSSEEVVWGNSDIDFMANYTLGHESVQSVQITAPTTVKCSVAGGLIRPTIEIVGTATSVQMSANNKSFSLGAFSNATIMIDGASYNVHKDGVSTLALMTGDFIELLNGENTIQIKGNGMNFKLCVKFRDKYI